MDKAERSIERLVEGTSGRLFRRSLQPAEIGRKIEREMVAKQWISVRGRVVPNSYMVALSPTDYVTFEPSLDPLCADLEHWLGERMTERGFTTIGGLEVAIFESSQLGKGEVVVTSGHRSDLVEQGQEPVIMQPTEDIAVYRPLPYVEEPGFAILDGPQTGRFLVVRKSMNSLGRALENDLVIAHPEVSRFHARVERGEGSIVVTDLGSTNGTFVGGRRIDRPIRLYPGDQVIFGAVTTEFI